MRVNRGRSAARGEWEIKRETLPFHHFCPFGNHGPLSPFDLSLPLPLPPRPAPHSQWASAAQVLRNGLLTAEYFFFPSAMNKMIPNEDFKRKVETNSDVRQSPTTSGVVFFPNGGSTEANRCDD